MPENDETLSCRPLPYCFDKAADFTGILTTRRAVFNAAGNINAPRLNQLDALRDVVRSQATRQHHARNSLFDGECYANASLLTGTAPQRWVEGIDNQRWDTIILWRIRNIAAYIENCARTIPGADGFHSKAAETGDCLLRFSTAH